MSVLSHVSASLAPLVLVLAASFELDRLFGTRPVILGRKPLVFRASYLLFFLLLRLTILLLERMRSEETAPLMNWLMMAGITVLQKFEAWWPLTP